MNGITLYQDAHGKTKKSLTFSSRATSSSKCLGLKIKRAPTLAESKQTLQHVKLAVFYYFRKYV